jgi:hypothetical protein
MRLPAPIADYSDRSGDLQTKPFRPWWLADHSLVEAYPHQVKEDKFLTDNVPNCVSDGA